MVFSNGLRTGFTLVSVEVELEVTPYSLVRVLISHKWVSLKITQNFACSVPMEP
jgi:hypothetical protein